MCLSFNSQLLSGARLRSSLQPDHIQVVKRHVVSIASEDEHVSLWINYSWVAISSRRLLSRNHAKVWLVWLSWVVSVVGLVLSLLHLLEVDVEWLVCILDDETVLHSDTSRWLETIVSFLSRVQIVFSSSVWWLSDGTFLCGWLRRGHSSVVRVPTLHWAAVVLASLWGVVVHVLNSRGVALSIWFIADSFIIWTKLVGRKIKNDQIVQFFSQLENSSEDVQFAAVDDCWVATACRGLVIFFSELNLAPSLACEIECPKIVKFVIIVVLASKNVKFIFINSSRQTCSRTRVFFRGRLKQICIQRGSLLSELDNLSDTRSINETSKRYKRSIFKVEASMVVSRQVFNCWLNQIILILLTLRTTLLHWLFSKLRMNAYLQLSSPFRPPKNNTSLALTSAQVWCEILPISRPEELTNSQLTGLVGLLFILWIEDRLTLQSDAMGPSFKSRPPWMYILQFKSSIESIGLLFVTAVDPNESAMVRAALRKFALYSNFKPFVLP